MRALPVTLQSNSFTPHRRRHSVLFVETIDLSAVVTPPPHIGHAYVAREGADRAAPNE
jgi:hypothetical protein